MTIQEREAFMRERDEILVAMDIERAKAFILLHGGTVPKRIPDWERVLHLARFECTNIPSELRQDSQIYLAMTGAQTIATLPQNSPYVRAALDLIFPVDVFEETMAELLP